VLRFDEVDGRIARLRGYAFCPETMREVGAALGLRVRTGLYRYPTPAPGQHWKGARTASHGSQARSALGRDPARPGAG
jgi:hypothetical protein